MRLFGVLLILLGVAAYVVGERGITRKREVAKIGKVFKATVSEHEPYPAARYAGVGLLVGGTALLTLGLRRRAA